MTRQTRSFALGCFVALLASPLSALAHGGATSRAPFEVCEERELGDACEWSHHDALHRGTCRGVAPSLRCVRNQPIVSSSAEESGHHHEADAHAHAGEEGQDAGHIPQVAFALVAAAALAFAWTGFGLRGVTTKL